LVKIPYTASIKFKIIMLCLLISIIFSLIVSYVIFDIFKKNQISDQIKSATHSLQSSIKSIDTDILEIYNVILRCSTDKDILKFLNASAQQPDIETALSFTALNALQNNLLSNSIENYINKVIIYSIIGDRSIIGGKYSGNMNDAELCKNLSYFDYLLNAKKYEWIGIVSELPTLSLNDTQCLPIIRPIYSVSSQGYLGWIYLSVSPKILINNMETYLLSENSDIFLAIGNASYKYLNSSLVPCEDNIGFNFDKNSKQVYNTTVNIDGEEKKALAANSKVINYTIIQTLPEIRFDYYRPQYINVIITFVLLISVVTLILYSVLNILVSKPIMKLMDGISSIANGNFLVNPSLEGRSEFGIIGQAINKMAISIDTFMKDKIKAEQIKKTLEFNILQNQINPHFMYNTLNTIKWMADMQKAAGISELTETLSKLLKMISKNTNSVITLKEELDVLKMYMLIQKYRYEDGFEYSIELLDEQLYNTKILKFSLQPIVENAIFHGIRPKGAGNILISINTNDSDMIITILDTGVGMSEEKINNILNNEVSEKGFFKKLGLHNVNERIKLEYGNQYGITIKSEIGSYTEVTLKYPKKYITDSCSQ